jgi:hypothetical protein
MSCQDRTRFEKEHSLAKARYEAARETLDSKRGVTSRDEFLYLSHAIDDAWSTLERAQFLLDRHLEEHGCKHSGEASAEAAGEG